MSIKTHISREPTHVLPWFDLTQGHGVPEGLYKVPGLYGVFKGGRLVYLGKTGNLSQRLGQLVGAICGGTGLHSGGYKVFERWDDLGDGDIHFELYAGTDLYARERELITALRPPLNGRLR